jgi:hypothetical protein
MHLLLPAFDLGLLLVERRLEVEDLRHTRNATRLGIRAERDDEDAADASTPLTAARHKGALTVPVSTLMGLATRGW